MRSVKHIKMILSLWFVDWSFEEIAQCAMWCTKKISIFTHARKTQAFFMKVENIFPFDAIFSVSETSIHYVFKKSVIDLKQMDQWWRSVCKFQG